MLKNQNNITVIDPGEAAPVINILQQQNLQCSHILITHHHYDHTGGVLDLQKAFPKATTHGPNLSHLNIKNQDLSNEEQFTINSFPQPWKILHTPGHTLDHIVYFNKKENLLFCGDVLFYYGCGRVFEGTMKQMLDTLNKIKVLPDDTKVFCGHEYTYKNLEFVFNELVTFPDKDAVKKKCREGIKKNGSSMPFNLGHQKAWNPFFNCNNIVYKKDIANFNKNKGKISPKANELEFFTFIRNKRNTF